MHKTTIQIEHKYNIGDIIEVPNKLNKKSIFVKVTNIEVAFDYARTSNYEIIRTFYFNGFQHPYKIYYATITLPNSYYDTLEITTFPEGRYLVFGEEKLP